jgi:hypothetical protein
LLFHRHFDPYGIKTVYVNPELEPRKAEILALERKLPWSFAKLIENPFLSGKNVYISKSRTMSGAHGEWLSLDPLVRWQPERLLGNWGDSNGVLYCDGDPVNFVDPSGHLSILAGGSINAGARNAVEMSYGFHFNPGFNGQKMNGGQFGSVGYGVGYSAGLELFAGFMLGDTSSINSPTTNFNLSAGPLSVTIMQDKATGSLAGVTAGYSIGFPVGLTITNSETGLNSLRDGNTMSVDFFSDSSSPSGSYDRFIDSGDYSFDGPSIFGPTTHIIRGKNMKLQYVGNIKLTEDNIDKGILRDGIVELIRNESPLNLSSDKQEIRFKGGFFRFVTSVNRLIAIEQGTVLIKEDKIVYRLHFKQLFLVVGVLYLLMSAFIYLNKSDMELIELPTVYISLALSSPFLYYGNKLIAIFRFKNLIKKALLQSRINHKD